MPYGDSASTSNLSQSFQVAGVHIIMLGSYTDFSVGSDQYNWLKSDLSKVDKSITPWILAVIHAPYGTTLIMLIEERQHCLTLRLQWMVCFTMLTLI